MKKSIGVIIAYLICQNLIGQSFSVGNTCCNYNVVNKTFVIPSSTCATASDNYSFDVDGDAVVDITITSFYSPPCFAGGVQSKGIMMTSTTGCEVAYSTAVTCPYRFLMNLPFGTPMDPSLNWSVTPVSWTIGQPSPYLYYEYVNPSSFSYTCSTQASTFYAGFRKILTNDTVYGWVLMNTNFPGILYSYAFKHTNISLDITSSVDQAGSMVFFPNPSEGELEIKGIKEEAVFISNELGQLIVTKNLNKENNYSVKLDNLQSGVYFVGNKYYRQKVVVIK